jgi:predicted dehydrogenase
MVLTMKNLINRRRFLERTASGGTGFLLLASARSVRGAPANGRLNIALVGVGGRGSWFAQTIPRLGQNLVALCDVDDSKNPDAYRQLPGAKRFRDFRKMLDTMSREIDAVIVATPDHTHAVAAAAAMRSGKPVFCEKPLTRTLHESRALRELARQHQVATSMGNQGTAAGPFRRALELIRDGAIGEVREVHIWNSEGGANRRELPKDGGPVPDFLDWDLWLGPADFRPYHRQWMQRNAWRDFGTCQLGNWASHSANLAFMALRVHDLWLDPPAASPPSRIRIESKHSGVNKVSFPKWEVVKWMIPARAGFSPITFTWHNGGAPGSRDLLESTIGEELDWGDKKERKWVDHGGAIIVGAKGRVRATEHNATFRLLPADRFEGVQTSRPEKVEESEGHERDWLRACRGGKPAWANFDYADALNEFLMLGNVSTQVESGTTLEFDPVAVKIVNHSEADALLRCEYRPGWRL